MMNIITPSIVSLSNPSYASNSALLLKIEDLFAKRRVLALAKSQLPSDAYQEWRQRAISIQRAIYEIDLYYEQSVALRSAEEGPLWQSLKSELYRDQHPSNEFLSAGFNDLQLYAEVETRIHEFDTLSPREFACFTQLKCADVRMARGLIFSYGARPSNSKVLRYWGLYDECWELIEDVVDIKEDGKDWNFNFWLYSFMAGRDPMISISASRDVLFRKLNELEHAYSQVPSERFDDISSSFRATVCGAKLAQNCWCRVARAIAAGNVRRFADQAVNRALVA